MGRWGHAWAPVHCSNSSSSRGSVSWIGGSYPQGAEGLVRGGGLAEPLLEDVERAGAGVVAASMRAWDVRRDPRANSCAFLSWSRSLLNSLN